MIGPTATTELDHPRVGSVRGSFDLLDRDEGWARVALDDRYGGQPLRRCLRLYPCFALEVAI